MRDEEQRKVFDIFEQNGIFAYPIYECIGDWDKIKNNLMEVCGSCILLNYKKRLFLVTAAHVLYERDSTIEERFSNPKEDKLFILLRDSTDKKSVVIKLNLDDFFHKGNPNSSNDDFAILELDIQLLEFNAAIKVTEEVLKKTHNFLVENVIANKIYDGIAIGYPSNKNTKRDFLYRQKGAYRRIWGKIENIGQNITPESVLVLSLGNAIRDIGSEPDEWKNIPKLNGMSGGNLVLYDGNDAYCIGLLITFDCNKNFFTAIPIITILLRLNVYINPQFFEQLVDYYHALTLDEKYNCLFINTKEKR